MAKQTATNNNFLKTVKKTYNEKIFKSTSKIVNEYGTGAGQDYIASKLYMYPERLEKKIKLWETE